VADAEDAGVLEDGGVEGGRLLGLGVEPEAGNDLLLHGSYVLSYGERAFASLFL